MQHNLIEISRFSFSPVIIGENINFTCHIIFKIKDVEFRKAFNDGINGREFPSAVPFYLPNLRSNYVKHFFHVYRKGDDFIPPEADSDFLIILSEIPSSISCNDIYDIMQQFEDHLVKAGCSSLRW